MIDGLYKQMKKQPKKKKGDSHFVTSQKKVFYTHEAAQKRKPVMPVAAAPKSKSRLFDYEAKHKEAIDAKRSVKFNVQEKPTRPSTSKPKKAPQVLDESTKQAVQSRKQEIMSRVTNK